MGERDRLVTRQRSERHQTAPSRPHARPSRGFAWFWVVGTALPLAFLLIFFVWPVGALLLTGFTQHGAVSLDAVPEVFGEPRTWRVIGQTLAQATLGTLLSLVIGIPAAFVLYRLEFPGRRFLRGLSTVPFVLPTVVVAVSFTALFGPGAPLAWLGLDQNLAVLVLALAFFNVTVVIRTVGGFWAQLDPRPEQAARMLGAGPARVWWTVALPTLAPSIASAASLVFLFCATSFGVVFVLGGRALSNIETEIYRLAIDFLDLRSAAVLSLAQFAIVAAVLVISSRARRRREHAVAMQFDPSRGASTGIRPGRAHLPVIIVFALTTLFLHVLPIGALLLRSLRGPDGALGFANYANLFDPPADSALRGSVWGALQMSLGTAVVATLIAVPLGMLTALVASRRPRSDALQRGARFFDSLVMLPLGVSAVTLGFGLLLTMHRPLGIGFDLRTSVVLIPIAQALVALPLVVRLLLPTLRGIDPRLRQAAMMLGASPFRVLATIDLPMLGRSAGLALGFAFATSLGEFGATAFLVRPGAQTLPVAIATLAGKQGAVNYGMALSAAVVLGVLTATVMLIAERWRGETAGEL